MTTEHLHIQLPDKRPLVNRVRLFLFKLPANSKHLGMLLLALLMALPLITLLVEAVTSDGDSFTQIRETVLSTYIYNTVLLMLLVGVFSALIGIPLAWLMASCEFKGRRFFNWALILPLAMPAYIVAYTYTDLLDYAGPIQIALRDFFGWQSASDYWFFDIRTLLGAAIVMALVLYPYVYLMVKASFLEQNATMTHAARMLGSSPKRSFFKVSLPLAKTAIIASCALVMMESMADFATVSYFAVNTLTTAVYDTWLGHYDLASATKLSSIMVMGILVLMYFERLHNGNKQTSNDAKSSQYKLQYQLSTKQTVAAWFICILVLLLAFVVPLIILVDYSLQYYQEAWQSGVLEFAVNSTLIAAATSILALLVALLINFKKRCYPTPVANLAFKTASSGYAIPGTVLAIGVLIPLTFMDVKINELTDYLGLERPGLLLSGTILTIIFAHLVRFVAIANKSIEASYEKISPSLDMVTKTVGQPSRVLLTRVHLPLLRKSAIVAALLIFVESMKELPAALLLRPFDFQTLPTYLYQFASDEQIEVAALGAVLIVLVGLIPLILLNKSIDKQY